LNRLAPTIIVLLMCLTVSGHQQTPGMISADADTPATVSIPAESQAVEVAASGLWIGIGPNMEVLPLGTYRFIFVPADSASNVEVTTITTGTGGPTPPPVGDLAARTSAALAKVTEAGKKTTATALLTVFEETNKSIASGSLTDQTQVSAALNLVLTYATAGKAGWSDFVKLAGDTLTASTSIKATEAALKVFIAELKKI